MRAGAVYDALFALSLVLVPERSATLLRLPLPGERFYLWLIALFLLSLAAFYLVIARQPAKYRELARLSGGIRLAGAVVLSAAAWGRPDLTALYLVGAIDLGFGLAHLALPIPDPPGR